MEKIRRNPARLCNLVKEFNLEILYKGKNYDNQTLTISDVNRPALQLVGFYDYFQASRLQILGRAEVMFLKAMSLDQRRRVLEELLRSEIPALIISRNMEVFPELVELARKYDRTLLRTPSTTVDISSRIIDYLNRQLAPQITRHGVLMNIVGQGVLLMGDSGIGKSETAIELLKRGHRLVADDAVEIQRVSGRLWGKAPEMIRHYIEIRGVGVIDVQQLFGMGAVQLDSEIELAIQLEPWEDGKFYDRLGLEGDTCTILGVSVPYVTIPVRPGRNLAAIVEIAAMKNRQMLFGYNPARDFVNRVDRRIDELTRQANAEENK